MRGDDYLLNHLLMSDYVVIEEGPSYGLPTSSPRAPIARRWIWLFIVQEVRGLEVLLDLHGCLDADV